MSNKGRTRILHGSAYLRYQPMGKKPLLNSGMPDNKKIGVEGWAGNS
jgi:hypothetical protein